MTTAPAKAVVDLRRLFISLKKKLLKIPGTWQSISGKNEMVKDSSEMAMVTRYPKKKKIEAQYRISDLFLQEGFSNVGIHNVEQVRGL